MTAGKGGPREAKLLENLVIEGDEERKVLKIACKCGGTNLKERDRLARVHGSRQVRYDCLDCGEIIITWEREL